VLNVIKPESELPTLDEVSELLRYEDGFLYWKKSRRGTVVAGMRAGRVGNRGYVGVVFGTHNLLAHRVIWLLCTGQWPKSTLDHVNGDPADNRIENLRLATQSQNNANRSPYPGRRFKGVIHRGGRYAARITKNGRAMHLGTYDTPEEAARVYHAKAVSLNGEFARPFSGE
jgi:hypothetical protein